MKDEKGKLIAKAKREERYQIEDFKRRLKNIEKIKPLFMEKGYTEECFNDTIAPHILMSKDKALSEYAQSPIFSAIFS